MTKAINLQLNAERIDFAARAITFEPLIKRKPPRVSSDTPFSAACSASPDFGRATAWKKVLAVRPRPASRGRARRLKGFGKGWGGGDPGRHTA